MIIQKCHLATDIQKECAFFLSFETGNDLLQLAIVLWAFTHFFPLRMSDDLSMMEHGKSLKSLFCAQFRMRSISLNALRQLAASDLIIWSRQKSGFNCKLCKMRVCSMWTICHSVLFWHGEDIWAFQSKTKQKSFIFYNWLLFLIICTLCNPFQWE